MLTIIKKFLGNLGFLWCPYCGRRLEFSHTKGYYGAEVYKCPHCDNLDRFDVSNFIYKGGDKKNAKKSKSKSRKN